MALRCLIVDDSAVFLRAASTLLEREGMAVTVASNSAEAMRLIPAIDPDIVLVDIDLGEEKGFDLVVRLADHTKPGGAVLRTILISTHVPEDFEELIEASPALGFLSKSALSAAAIRKLMNGSCGGHPEGC